MADGAAHPRNRHPHRRRRVPGRPPQRNRPAILGSIRTLAAILALALPALGARLPLRIFTTADGLARDAVNCIVPDSKGFLWFCTAEGVSRYDGYEFTTFGVAQGLPHRSVNAVLEAHGAHTYYIGTTLGLSRLDPSVAPGSPPRFVSIPVLPGHAAPEVLTLLESHSGEVWCGTVGGLYRLRDRPVGLEPQPFPPGTSQVVRALAEDSQGALWIGTAEGLLRRTPGGGIQPVFPEIGRQLINAIAVDRFGTLWVATLEGLWRITPNVRPRRYGDGDGLPSSRIHSLFETRSGTFWIGTAAGLARLDASHPQHLAFRNYGSAEGLKGRVIMALGEDSQGSLWAGVDHGLARISHDGFETFTASDGIGDLSIVQLLESRGELFAVSNETSAIVLYRLQNSRFTRIRPAYPSAMHYFGWATGHAAVHARNGEWWIATGQGLCRFPAVSAGHLPATRPAAVYTQRDGLPSNDVLRVFEDSLGNVWAGGEGPSGNLARWDPRTHRFELYGFADCPGLPSAFAEDAAGNLWIAFSNTVDSGRPSGLLRQRQGRFEEFLPPSSRPWGWVLDLYTDRKGRLWIGSTDGSLASIANPAAPDPHITPYGGKLSSTVVDAIAEDTYGRLYVATPRGIDRIDPDSGRSKRYTAEDGVASGSPASLIRDSAGRIWVGTSLGLSVLNPAPDPRPSRPRVFITALSVEGEPRPVAEPGLTAVPALRLAPGERQFSVRFVGLGAPPGDSIRYQYRLDGADRDWSAPSEQRTVSYAGLGFGRFQFRVRAVTASGAASAEPAVVSFEVLAPVWRRWWFLALIALSTAAAVFLAHRYDVSRRLQIERVRIRLARDLHDDLGANLSRVAILAELAKRDAAPSRLTEIADLVRGMVDGLGDLVWATDPRSDDLACVARRIRSFASDVLTAQNIDWKLDLPADPSLPLGPEQRRQLLLIFQESIRNAARHSGCSSVCMSVRRAGTACIVRVADNGRGLPSPYPNTGNGIANMRARAAALGGSLALESGAGMGTAITIRFVLSPSLAQRIRMLFRLVSPTRGNQT